MVDKIAVGLDELRSSESDRITDTKSGSHSNLHQLTFFGLQPGVGVTVPRVNPTFCIKFENTELAIDEEIARNIFVLKTGNVESYFLKYRYQA